MRIAIDLNDVIRAYSKTFAKYYKKEFDPSVDFENLDLKSNDLFEEFNFNSKEEYQKFLYEDYPYEIFGSCPSIEKDLPARFNNWLVNVVENIECDENFEFIIVSPMEFSLSIQSTFFFLSKIGCRVREVFFPKNSVDIWNICDALITANPKLLDCKPDKKISIKINMSYNTKCNADYSYSTFADFISNENNLTKLLDNEQ